MSGEFPDDVKKTLTFHGQPPPAEMGNSSFARPPCSPDAWDCSVCHRPMTHYRTTGYRCTPECEQEKLIRVANLAGKLARIWKAEHPENEKLSHGPANNQKP